jgi:serine/threonine protein phosphatase PrpC
VYSPSPIRTAQSQTLHPPLVAFAGVFDGHDGPLASTYCSNGLLQHILIETYKSIHDEENEFKDTKEAPKAAYVLAFHHAQDQFSRNRDPPTFEDLKGKQAMKKQRDRSVMHLLGSKDKAPKRGGTTACIISIVSDCCDPRAM